MNGLKHIGAFFLIIFGVIFANIIAPLIGITVIGVAVALWLKMLEYFL